MSFNGGFENDSPYYKGDINYDIGETTFREVGVFARWQRRKQVVNHIKGRFDFFCMVESYEEVGRLLEGCELYIHAVVVVSLVDKFVLVHKQL